MEVKNEYAKGAALEPTRQWLLNRLRPEQGFFRLCTSYDSLTMDLVNGFKGIDKGEAESYAQFRKIDAHVIISDDVGFTHAIKSLDSTIKVCNTLHLICWLDLQKFIPDWDNMIRSLYRIRKFKSSDLRLAYIDTLRRFGAPIDKKVISRKCSLTKIL